MRKQDLDILQSILDTRGGFSHREHLELVWGYLRIYEAREAHRAVASAITHVASAHRAPDKYHETITRCWVHLVALHCAESDAKSFDQFIADSPGLLDRHLLDRHYSPELLSSAEARTRWAQPDLRQLPQAP
jgi:hemerythrin